MSDVRKEHFPVCDCTELLDHSSHARLGIHPFPDKLYVVTMLENPLRYRNRYNNYADFERHMEDSGAILYTAELATGERHFEITDPTNPRHLQLRLRQEPWHYELWHKENALNLLMNRLPLDAKYIAWIDSDVEFARPDWAQETMHLLQHYQVLQMFSHTQDLGPEGEPLGQSVGYVFKKYDDPTFDAASGIYYSGGGGRKGVLWTHPGFAWAARRDALNLLGGLIDWCILGSGDWMMAASLFGEVHRALNPEYHINYRPWAEVWQDRAEKYIRRNVGYMPGLVLHKWHGTKKNRNYDTRWKLLADTKFDPVIHLKKDTQGLWTLTQETEFELQLREGIRKYSRLRNEDSPETK